MKVLKYADEMQVVHLREGQEHLQACGGATIVIIPKNNDLSSVGISVCNDLDNYNRKRGYTIAKGRAEKKPFLTFSADVKLPIQQLIFDYLRSKGVPEEVALNKIWKFKAEE